MQKKMTKSSLITFAIAVLFTAMFNFTPFFGDLSAKNFTLYIVAFLVLVPLLMMVTRKLKSTAESRG
jgi:cadmium resistance protein CadD (predicted permease)